jgi:hypothetical protein
MNERGGPFGLEDPQKLVRETEQVLEQPVLLLPQENLTNEQWLHDGYTGVLTQG